MCRSDDGLIEKPKLVYIYKTEAHEGCLT